MTLKLNQILNSAQIERLCNRFESFIQALNVYIISKLLFSKFIPATNATM